MSEESKSPVSIVRTSVDDETNVACLSIDKTKVLSEQFKEIALAVFTECLAGSISSFSHDKERSPESSEDVAATFNPAVVRARKYLSGLAKEAAEMMFDKFLNEDKEGFFNKSVADAIAIVNSFYKRKDKEEN